MGDPDNIYYNSSVYNDSSSTVLKNIEFNEVRTEAILTDPSNYYLSIERLLLPRVAIPIFIMKPGCYKVTIRSDDVDYTTDVTPIGGPPEINKVSQFLGYINNALNISHTNAGGGIDEEPFFEFTPETGLISLYVIQTYTFEIFVNTCLTTYLRTFPGIILGLNNADNKDFQYYYYAAHGLNYITLDGNDYYKMTQDFQTINQWNDLTKIVMTSSVLNQVSENIASRNELSTNISLDILTDFLGPLSNDVISDLRYFGPPSRRWISLQGRTPLKQIQYRLFWEDTDQKLFPIRLYPGTYFSVKMLFRKRDTLPS